MTMIHALGFGVTTLLVAMMISPSQAAIPGPNDPRYPDVIVEPKVICDKEGVFPHPRNCSWYYRCVDRMNIGYYWTYHFECEPGTVFSDDLDQCVFPFAIGPPCGTSGVSLPTAAPSTRPPIVTSPLTVKTTPVPITTLETTVQTITSPTVSKNFNCSFQPDNCAIYKPCFPGETEKALCTGCYVDGLHISAFFLCGKEEGKLFDRDSNVCVDDPRLNSNCPLQDTTTPEPTTTTPIPTTVPIITTNNPTTLNFTIQNLVNCTIDNVRPQADWIIDRFCNKYFLCGPDGKYQGSVSLCNNYYECSYTPNEGWELNRMECPRGMLFTYEKDRCVDEPTDEEICSFGGR